MTTAQVVLLLTTLVVLSWSQVYNGYINPLFLPRVRGRSMDVYRRGRLLDPYYINPYSDLRDNGYSLSRGNPYIEDNYRRPPLDYRFDGYRRYLSQYDGDRRLPVELDQRYSDLYPWRYPSRGYQSERGEDLLYQGLGTTVTPLGLDRGQLLERGQGLGLDRGQLLERGQGLGLDRGQLLVRGQEFDLDRGQSLERVQGLGLERGQVFSTASPDIAVTVQPNGSA